MSGMEPINPEGPHRAAGSFLVRVVPPTTTTASTAATTEHRSFTFTMFLAAMDYLLVSPLSGLVRWLRGGLMTRRAATPWDGRRRRPLAMAHHSPSMPRHHPPLHHPRLCGSPNDLRLTHLSSPLPPSPPPAPLAWPACGGKRNGRLIWDNRPVINPKRTAVYLGQRNAAWGDVELRL